VESNWRLNVYRFGLDGTRIGLCSPLFGNPFWKLSDYTENPGFHWAFFNHPSDPNNYNFATLLPDAPGRPHFPYGWLVEPD